MDEDYCISYIHKKGKGEDAEPPACAISTLSIWYNPEVLIDDAIDALERRMK